MSTNFPQRTTQRLLLRQITESDLPNIYRGLSHPRVIPYYGVSYDSLEATQAQMDWYASLEKEGTGIWWAVCEKDSGAFIGAGGLNDLSKEHRRAEIGFWLLPEYWGQGYMQEAMQAIIDYSFEGLNLHRIEGYVETENTNCQRGIAKLGFKNEGTMVDCEWKNGRFISVMVFALLSS
ncbi:MAG: GNAT family N-acetyltransferase [Bacteroidota bacterium]